MHLTRLLVFLAGYYGFWFHVLCNCLADALSRNNAKLFLSQVTGANPQVPEIPGDLVALVTRDINWTSTPWMSLFGSITQLL